MELSKLCYHCMTFTVDADGCCSICKKHMPIKQSSSDALPAGTIIGGRYLLGRSLGNGGFGKTYIAMDLTDRRRIAVKEFFPDKCARRNENGHTLNPTQAEQFESCRRKFEAEAQTLHGLRTLENIVHIEALLRDNETSYYVMEYLEGMDLLNYTEKNGGRLSYDTVIEIVRPLFSTLRRIHATGIIHRDISPDNIFVCSNGTVKLIDFGAARARMYGLTETGNLSLKPNYAAIEQYVIRGNHGPWTDVYGLAATIYYCVTGKLPAEANSRILTDCLKPPSELCTLTPAQERVILKGLAMAADDRYQTVEEFGCALLMAKNDEEQKRQSGSLYLRRVAAYLIDFVPLGFLSALILYLSLGSPNASGGLICGIMLIMPLLPVALATALEALPVGASPGELLLGLRVERNDEGKPQWWRLLCRNLLRAFFYPGILCYLFSAGRLSLCDLWLKTRVRRVDKPKATTHPFSGGTDGAWVMEGLSGLYAGQRFPLADRMLIIGRKPQCNLVFPDGTAGVSGVHCSLHPSPDRRSVKLCDLGSSNGTFVNDNTRLSSGQETDLHNGDTFTVGLQRFRIFTL